MKNLLRNLGKVSLVLLTALLIGANVKAATFTAVASGNWSSTVTWGGTVPSLTNTLDQVTIPIGITVTMDNSVTLNGVLASLTVNGTLMANAGTTLTTTLGTVAGAGVITTDNAVFGVSALFSFTGAFTTNTLSNWALTLNSAANIMVNQSLTLATGTLSIMTGGSLSTATNATIIDSAGALSLSGGTLSLVSSYNVIYNGSSISTGIELSGTSTLNNLTISVSGLSTVTLMSDVTVNGTLTLTSGVLALNAYNLNITGNVSGSGTGTITVAIPSSISINNSTGITGTINFTSGINTVSNFTVNVGANNHVEIGGNLTVSGNLALTSGSLNFNSSDLTISGAITGTGTLSGNTSSNLTITTTGGVSVGFAAGGQMLNNFFINVGSNNSVHLTSDLTTSGTLTLSGNINLDISSVSLTLNGDLQGTGSIMVNSNSNLTINTTGGLTAALTLSGTSIGNFNLNIGALGNVTLGSNLVVAGTLTLQSGALILNSNNLTVNGNISGSGSGTISSTNTSNISLHTTTGITGTLNFTSGLNSVNNLTVNVGANYHAQIHGTLLINGTLSLTSGTLIINSSDITINGNVSGSGMLSGDAMTNLSITTSGGLSGGLSFATGGQWLNNFVINVGNGNSVTLTSDLNVAGTLSLTGGSDVNISSQMLTLNGNLNGSGSFIVNTSSSLTLDDTSSLTSGLIVMGNLGDLTVNLGNTSNVMLGGDLTVSGTLDLQNGTLVLNSHNLNITGNIAAGGTGMISSTASSNVSVNTSMNILGTLNFSSSGNFVNNFDVNISGSWDPLMLGSDLWVQGMLNFTSGYLNIGSNTLWVTGSAMITGASSTSYIITGIGGSLAMSLTAGDTTGVIFPVGTSIRYYPARVVLNAGSTSGDIMVGAVDHVWANGTSGINLSTDQPLVDATWMFNTDISSNLNLNMWLMWETSAEINSFDRTHAYISHYTSGAWDVNTITSATAQGNLYAMERMHLTSLSPFAIFDQATSTGVPQVAKTADIEVYPNPASDNIYIKNNFSYDDNVFASITDDFGQVLGTYRISSDNTLIPLDGLSAGNYIIKVYNDKMNTVIRKIVKL